MTGYLPLSLREPPVLWAPASRALDLAVAGGAALALLPVMGLIALAIRAESAGPVLFSQLRLGQGGRAFRMYKFRKFSAACGTEGSPLTLEGDSRLTGVGRVLAATKLDELPQLWNVIRGDMALVGPRPESLAFADCFADGFERLLDFKPGLLGPSQILFRNESRLFPAGADPSRFYRDVLFPMKARIDLAYFPRRTLGSDLACLARGLLAVCGWAPAPASIPAPGAVRERDPQRREARHEL